MQDCGFVYSNILFKHLILFLSRIHRTLADGRGVQEAHMVIPYTNRKWRRSVAIIHHGPRLFVRPRPDMFYVILRIPRSSW